MATKIGTMTGGWGMQMIGFNAIMDLFDDIEANWAGSSVWLAGTEVHYAVFLEFGTSKMPAYPFARPAVDRVMQTQADGIADSADSIEELVSDLAQAISDEMSSVIQEKDLIDTGKLLRSIHARPV